MAVKTMWMYALTCHEKVTSYPALPGAIKLEKCQKNIQKDL